MAENSAVLRVQELSDKFYTETGVRQRNDVSGVLFNLVLEDAIRKCDIQGMINVSLIQTCAYTVDVALIARNRESLTQANVP